MNIFIVWVLFIDFQPIVKGFVVWNFWWRMILSRVAAEVLPFERDMVTKIEPMTMKKRMLILKQRKLHLIYSITNHLQWCIIYQVLTGWSRYEFLSKHNFSTPCHCLISFSSLNVISLPNFFCLLQRPWLSLSLSLLYV